MVDKKKPEHRINTGGGDFVDGNQNKVHVNNMGGGMLVVGNQNVVSAQQTGAGLADLVRLVAEMRALLPRVQLDSEVRAVVEADLKVVEEQTAKPEPKKALVLPKLKSIVETLATAAVAGDAIQKLLPIAQQAVQWAQQVLK
jgi:hypothetical protein